MTTVAVRVGLLSNGIGIGIGIDNATPALIQPAVRRRHRARSGRVMADPLTDVGVPGIRAESQSLSGRIASRVRSNRRPWWWGRTNEEHENETSRPC